MPQDNLRTIRSQIWKSSYSKVHVMDLMYYLRRLRFFQTLFLISIYLLVSAIIVVVILYFQNARDQVFVTAAIPLAIAFVIFLIGHLILAYRGVGILLFLISRDTNFDHLYTSYLVSIFIPFVAEPSIRKASKYVTHVTGEQEL